MMNVYQYLDTLSNEDLMTIYLECEKEKIPENTLIRKVINDINERIKTEEISFYPDKVYVMTIYPYIAGVLAHRYIKSLINGGK